MRTYQVQTQNGTWEEVASDAVFINNGFAVFRNYDQGWKTVAAFYQPQSFMQLAPAPVQHNG